MQSPAYAIAWEIWRKNRWGILIIVAAIPVWALFSRALVGPLQPSGDETLKMLWPMLVLLADIVPMWVSVMALGVMFCFTEADARRGAPQFPARLFTLPVRTTTLVIWPMLYGVLAVLMVSTAWEKLVLSSIPRTEWMPIHFMPAIFVATAMVLLQATVWSLPAFPANRLIVLSLLLFGLVWLAVWPRAHAGAGDWTEEQAAVFQRNSNIALVGVSVLAYFVALVAVERDRRGGRFGWAALWARVSRFAEPSPRWNKPFGSAGAAQFWFEWRRGGWMLPAVVGFFMTLILGPISWVVMIESPPSVTAIDADSTVTMLCLVLTLPLWLSFVIGQRNAEIELKPAPFQLLRPLTSGETILAKQRSAFVSAMLSWLMVLVAAPVWLALWCDTSALGRGWQMLEARHSTGTVWVMVLLTLVAAVALTWRWLVVSLYMGLWGRPRIFIWRAAVCIFGGWLLLIYLAHLFDHPKQVKQWLEAGRYLAGLALVKVLIAGWVFHRTHRRGSLPVRIILWYLAIWIGVTLCLASLGSLWLAPTNLPKSVRVSGAMLLVPLARLGLAPLAFEAGRHR